MKPSLPSLILCGVTLAGCDSHSGPVTSSPPPVPSGPTGPTPTELTAFVTTALGDPEHVAPREINTLDFTFTEDPSAFDGHF